MAGGQARPVRDRAAARPLDGAAVLVGAHLLAVGADVRPRPALRGVLPGLLAPVDRLVEHRVRAAHRLVAPAGGPVGLEDPVAVAQVAHVHPEVPPRDQRFLRGLGHRVEGHLPAQELAVAVALRERPLAEDGERHVARVQERQLAHLRVVLRAAFALLGGRGAAVPHHVRREELRASLEGVDQADLAGRSDQWRGRIDLDHRQSSPGGGDRVALTGVRLLADPGARPPAPARSRGR